MTNLLLEFGADYDAGIWPKRDATSPYVLAEDRGYDEIVEVFRTAREKKRRDRGPKVPEKPSRKSAKPICPAARSNAWPCWRSTLSWRRKCPCNTRPAGARFSS